MSDLISRQETLDALDLMCDIICPYSKKQRYVMCGACAMGNAFDVIRDQPSVQPDSAEQPTGCHDCPEYDTEHHYCDKFCRIIHNTVAELREQYGSTD